MLLLAENIADDRWQAQLAHVRAAGLAQMREDLLAAAFSKKISSREIDDLETITIADVEKMMRGDSSQVRLAIRKAATKFVGMLTDNPYTPDELFELLNLERELSDATDATLAFAESIQSVLVQRKQMRDFYWPQGIYQDETQLEVWLRVLEEAQRRRFVAECRDRILADIADARAILPRFSGSERISALASLMDATRDDLAQRGSDVESVCRKELAQARRVDAGALEGGGGGGGGRRAASRAGASVFSSPTRKRSKSRSKSPSRRQTETQKQTKQTMHKQMHRKGKDKR